MRFSVRATSGARAASAIASQYVATVVRRQNSRSRAATDTPDVPADLTALAGEEAPAAAAAGERPRIDLLAATAAGAPNVVSLEVTGTEVQGAKEFDDVYIGMHFGLAQQLVSGRGEHKVTALVLQLNRSEDMPAVRARLVELFHTNNLPLEVRDFIELTPFYGQALDFAVASGMVPASAVGTAALDRRRAFRNDLAIGGSYSTSGEATLILEYDFHEAGLSSAQLRGFCDAAAAGNAAAGQEMWLVRGYAADELQPLGRHEAFARVSWNDAFVRDLELDAWTIVSLQDGSALTQVEHD
jgi:hypothetical protein